MSGFGQIGARVGTNPRRWIVGLALTIPLLVLLYLGFRPALYTSLQTPLFLFLNQTLGFWPAFWENLTELGNGFLALALFSPLILINPRAWAAMLGAIPAAAILSRVGKETFGMPRPAAVLDQSSFDIIGPILTSHNSLPSGHTTTIVTACAALALVLFSIRSTSRWNLWIAWAALALGALAGLSRVVVGAHWPLDVVLGTVCGLIAGWSGAALTRRFSGWWRWMDQPQRFYIHILILALVLLGLRGEGHVIDLPLAQVAQLVALGVMALVAYQARTAVRAWIGRWFNRD